MLMRSRGPAHSGFGHRVLVRFPLVAAVATLAACGGRIESTDNLYRAIHDRYHGTWYRTVNFEQDNVFYHPDGSESRRSVWGHAFNLPGELRIDVHPVADGNGTLIARDSIYSFRNGELVGARAGTVSLLLIAFDAYLIPPETTLALLEELEFDHTRFREDEWQGRPVFVIGAEAGDLQSRQFWIDQQHWYAVRVVEPVGDGRVRDLRFNGYQRLGGGWIAPEVVMLLDGKPDRLERYRDMQVDVPIDPARFDPHRWTAARGTGTP